MSFIKTRFKILHWMTKSINCLPPPSLFVKRELWMQIWKPTSKAKGKYSVLLHYSALPAVQNSVSRCYRQQTLC